MCVYVCKNKESTDDVTCKACVSRVTRLRLKVHEARESFRSGAPSSRPRPFPLAGPTNVEFGGDLSCMRVLNDGTCILLRNWRSHRKCRAQSDGGFGIGKVCWDVTGNSAFQWKKALIGAVCRGERKVSFVCEFHSAVFSVLQPSSRT